MFNSNLGLVRFGTIDNGWTLPLKHLEVGGYKAYPNRRQDLTAERNADGELIREVASNRPSTLTVSFLPMNESDMQNILTHLSEAYINDGERKLSVTFYDTVTATYRTELMYVPDFEMTIDYIDNGQIYYDTLTLEFIGY